MARGAAPSDPVRVVARLEQMPRYHEQVLVDELAAKMRREYGSPPRGPRFPSPMAERMPRKIRDCRVS